MIQKQKKLISKILIILFFISYFVPSFYSFDRIGNQWLYLSIICSISFLFILFETSAHSKIKSLFKEKGLITYSIFIIWAMVSILYSFNKSEAIVTFNQYFTVFISFVIIKILLTNIPNGINLILKMFLLGFFLEIILSISPILVDIEKGELVFRSTRYIGAAANVNITSFSLLYKTPILLYFFCKENRIFLKIIYVLAFISTLLIISVLGTRSAYISVVVIIISYIIYLTQLKNRFLFKIKHILPIIGSALIILFISSIISEKGADIISRASTISIDTNDGSVNQRLRYYKQGISYFFENPFFGTGIGNWKIFSIKYDREHIDGYIVPYHAHNDFIQLLVELGVFGLLLYSTFIFYSIKKLFRIDFFENKINFLFLGIAGTYFIDSMLNFPIARPISQIFLIFFICLISLYNKKSYV